MLTHWLAVVPLDTLTSIVSFILHSSRSIDPPSLNMTPEGELEVELNQEVTITCEVDGSPKPLISWLFEGEEILMLKSSNELRLLANKGSISGEYTCQAENSMGDVVKSTLQLKVVYPPKISIEKVWIHSSPTMRSEVACEIDGSPIPEVEWYHDNSPVVYSNRIYKSRKGRKHILVITRTTTSDFGFYKCIASNKLGSSQQVVQLSALPHMAVFKKTNQEKLPKEITLAWEVESYSPILQYSLLFREYQRFEIPTNWTKIVVPGDTSSTGPIHTQIYMLTGLKRATVYEASVLSKNRFGWSRPSNIYRFATLGKDLNGIIASVGDAESNTVNEYFPDFVATSDIYHNSSQQSSSSVYILLLSHFYIFIFFFM